MRGGQRSSCEATPNVHEDAFTPQVCFSSLDFSDPLSNLFDHRFRGKQLPGPVRCQALKVLGQVARQLGVAEPPLDDVSDFLNGTGRFSDSCVEVCLPLPLHFPLFHPHPFQCTPFNFWGTLHKFTRIISSLGLEVELRPCQPPKQALSECSGI